VRCVDLSRERFRESDFAQADFIGFHLPMHTATRLAAEVIPRVVRLNPGAHLCAYGLYASMNEDFLRGLGIRSTIGGEFEEELAELVSSLIRGRSPSEPLSSVSTRRQQFLAPDRSSLPPLRLYSQLTMPDGTQRMTGYTEASRGCKHLCRHCPIVPVYEGKFRIVQREVVMEDIRRQVAGGARHITFGDPDFFNGIGHATALVRALHDEFPDVTYDVTIKIEHLLRHSRHLATLKQTGCAFVTSAVESVDNEILRILDKGHTRADFTRVVEQCRAIGLPLAPTFVSFTPWITLQGYFEMLEFMAELDVVDWIAPVQWAIRLLIPKGSLLLELPEVRHVLTGFNAAALSFQWRHPDPRMDALQREIEQLARQAGNPGTSRYEVYEGVRGLVLEAKGGSASRFPPIQPRADRCTIPYLTEPWYC
jgi:radical SAM superfamily enzyme YgiQ (UPF0313 family)